MKETPTTNGVKWYFTRDHAQISALLVAVVCVPNKAVLIAGNVGVVVSIVVPLNVGLCRCTSSRR
jgi:hypothetical protein